LITKNDSTMMDAEEQSPPPPPLAPHQQPEVVIADPQARTYPADILDGIRKTPKNELNETQKANLYHRGNKHNSDYKEQPTGAEITSFYLGVKGLYSSVLNYGKDVVIEKCREFARTEGLKLQPGNQNPASLEDIISILTKGESAKVEYNKNDNIRKTLLFKLQYKLWGKGFWMEKAAEYCKENRIVIVDGNPAKLGSIGRTMSESKTWISKVIQDSCNRAFGTHVGCRDRVHDNSRIVAQFFDGNTKVLVMKPSKKLEPAGSDPAATVPEPNLGSLKALLSDRDRAVGDVAEWLRQHIHLFTLITPDPNKGAYNVSSVTCAAVNTHMNKTHCPFVSLMDVKIIRIKVDRLTLLPEQVRINGTRPIILSPKTVRINLA